MQVSEMLKYLDHTQLKPVAVWEDIKKICDEAVKYKTASVCIPPCYIQKVRETYKDSINICTVIGFPLGYSTTETKVFETKDALEKGADEIDMVINITDLKNKEYEKILDEISKIKEAAGEHILKVIIETCYLTDEEKIKMCEIITKAGADFIKTSTGFGSGGATFEDVKLFSEHIGKNVKIKAAGGVSSIEDMQKFIDLGCARIGTSRGVSLVQESSR